MNLAKNTTDNETQLKSHIFSSIWCDNLFEANQNHFKNNTITKALKDSKINNPSAIEELLNKIKKPEEWISLCFEAETTETMKNAETVWISGLEKFHNSSLYLENLGFFYFRGKKYNKALEYLKSGFDISHSLLGIKVGIASAYALSQYHLVWDYYALLSENSVRRIEDELLSKVAISALHQSLYQEAENIFLTIRNRHNLPQLPSLEESLLESFGSKTKMQKWIEEMKENSSTPEKRKKYSLGKWVTYASTLIYRKEYREALDILTKIKNEKESLCPRTHI
ncbi:MAG: hypothetical protein OEZ13_05725 [Spirochaetia bacterium]|nr:hypothetical protein [Spirochaetia bacterium]